MTRTQTQPAPLRQQAISAALAFALIFIASFAVYASAATQNPKAQIDFNREIRPILSENCFKCHGPDDGSRKAKLRLDLRAEALKPAKSGQTAIVPGAPEKSELLARVTTEDQDDRMPPVKTGKNLTASQIESLRRWIAQGAPYATHWAYVKPTRPSPPAVKNKRWAINPIDLFILSRLERERLKPSPQANPYILARRVSLDLTGLPPSPDEVDRFVKDKNPRAYEDLVDRLLRKNAFGEHWTRMWLDIARYADSAGYADDPPRTIWAYRDYVIKSFNAGKPFDRFTLEQIAGDLLDDSDEDDLVATAFHRNTMTNNEGGTNDEEFRNAAVVDRVNTTMAVWMATSMGCAQCHNHKYDPISQKEYFSYFAFFNNTADADLKDESPLLELYNPEQKLERTRLQDEIAAIEKTFLSATPESLAAQAKWEENFPRERQWLSLKPAALKARDGGSIEAADDNKVRIAPQQRMEAYTLELLAPPSQIAGIRIEAFGAADESKSEEDNNDYVITHVTAKLIPLVTNSVAGRYVRIELPGKEKFLSLAEVQVFAGTKNLATEGNATQSSTAFDGPANLAIDGNTDGDYETSKSTTHTEASENPWWEVDLKGIHSLDQIVVWNRTDHDLQHRLGNFRVLVLDEHRKPVWTKNVKDPPNPNTAFAIDGSVPLNFTAVFADTNSPGSGLRKVIEEQGKERNKGWSVNPGDHSAHYLTLLPARAVEVPPDSRLRLTIEQFARRVHSPPSLLRVSASEDRRISDYAAVPNSILGVLATPPSKRSERDRDSLVTYYRANVAPELKPERDQLVDLKKRVAAITPNTVPIMRELANDKRRLTRIEFRGNYLSLGDEVSEDVPAAFPALSANVKRDRLALARWLVDTKNPLTARVIANRLWEQIFGTGIVRTSEDFGSQGDLPTHPELLDWLATELVAQKWDIKAFLRMLVTSAAYRQSSRVTPELQERDPQNLLLARGPRFRMAAEVVRDQALGVSGLLSPKMYGPPVRPPRPSLGLNAAFGGSLDWKPSEGEDRYRRALYIEWRRTSPYPSMATFDAPNREVCTLRRPRSNTPLQALVTLNDPVYIEAARHLALRMAQSPGSVADKATYGFRLCLLRPPQRAESDRLVSLYRAAKAAFEGQPESAKQMAANLSLNAKPSVAANDTDVFELAAWTAVGNVLLNLDETLMRP